MITAYGGQASTKNPILVVDESRLSAVIRQPVPPAVSFQGLTRDRLERRPVWSLPPSKPPTGPAPPRRSVCALGTMSIHSICRPTWKRRTYHVIHELAAQPSSRCGSWPRRWQAPATTVASGQNASTGARSPGRPLSAQHLHRAQPP